MPVIRCITIISFSNDFCIMTEQSLISLIPMSIVYGLNRWTYCFNMLSN